MKQLILTSSETLALNLLRNTPGEIQKVARPDGTISIVDLHEYFSRLNRQLEFAQSRRREEYIDVDPVVLVETI